MGVVLVVVGQVVVQHEAHVVDVNAAGGNVGGHECLNLAALEIVERALTHGLATSAVQCAGLHASAVEVFAHIVDAVTGLHEHNRWAVLFDEGNGCVDALGWAGDHETVIDRCLLDIVHQVVTHRIFHVVLNDLLHIAVERC